MPTFEKAEEARDEPLTLPVRNLDGVVHEYVFEPITASDLLTLTIVQNKLIRTLAGQAEGMPVSESNQVKAMTQRAYMDAVVGGPRSDGTPTGPSILLDRMFADRVGGRMLTLVLLTVQKWHMEGSDAAHKVWTETVVNPVDPQLPTTAGIRGPGTGEGSTLTGLRSSTRSPKAKPKQQKRRSGRR